MRVILISGDQILFLGLIFQGKVIKIYIHYGKFKLFFFGGGGDLPLLKYMTCF